MLQAAVLLSTSPATTPAGEELDPLTVSPGLTGFLATFALVVVSIALFVSMARRLRRLQYRAEHEGAAGAQGASTGSAGASRPDDEPGDRPADGPSRGPEGNGDDRP